MDASDIGVEYEAYECTENGTLSGHLPH